MKKRALVVAAAAMVLMMSACGSSGSGGSNAGGNTGVDTDGSGEKTTVVTSQEENSLRPISVSHHPYIHGLPTIVAQEQGIYEKNGLKPDITMYAGGTAQNEACATNAWQVGTTGMAGAVLGYLGYDFKVIGASAYEGTVDLWVRPDSPIAAIANEIEGYPQVMGNAEAWKGKTVICQSASNCHLLLLATLEKMGLTDKDVEIVDMSVAQSYPAFKAGEGDIVALWSPFGYQAEKEGWIKISSAEAVGLNYYTLMIATDKAIKEEPELVQAWTKTYVEGTDVIRNNQKDAVSWLYDFSMDEGITTTMENCEKDIELRFFPTLEQQKELMSGPLQDSMLQFAKFLYDQGSITEEDYNKMLKKEFIDTRFIDAIAEEK